MSQRRCYRVLVCRGPECGDKRNSRAVYDRLRQLIDERRLGEDVSLDWQSCFGRCTQGPNVLVREIDPRAARAQSLFAPPPAVRGARTALYNEIDEVKARDIVDGHLQGDQVQTHLIEQTALARSGAGAANPPSDPGKEES